MATEGRRGTSYSSCPTGACSIAERPPAVATATAAAKSASDASAMAPARALPALPSPLLRASAPGTVPYDIVAIEANSQGERKSRHHVPPCVLMSWVLVTAITAVGWILKRCDFECFEGWKTLRSLSRFGA